MKRVPKEIRQRLKYIREQIQAESISYREVLELQSLVKYIGENDVLLLEWAGVPEGGELMKYMYIVKYRVDGGDCDVSWFFDAKSQEDFKPGELDQKAKKVSADWEATEQESIEIENVYQVDRRGYSSTSISLI